MNLAHKNIFSQVETAAVRDYLTGKSSSVKLFLTYHSYGQYILHPWGYARSNGPNWQRMSAVGKLAAEAMWASSGNKYTVGSAGKLLGAAAGTMIHQNYGLFF